jgi:carbon-monoxide dehydrogenase medium subunit
MVNTHILAKDFEYREPKTVGEALQQIKASEGKAKVIAGGTDLLVQMKMGEVQPKQVINISRIASLRYLIEEKGLRIGTLTPFQEIETSQRIRKQYTALYEAARDITSVQIKHMGTIGGNLCNASPAADTAPPLIVFGGKVKLAQGNQERVLLVEKFFIGPGMTVLSPQEILIEVQLPPVREGMGSAFKKIGRVSADIAKVNVAVALVRKDDICEDCRIVFGSVAPKPLRTIETEKVLRGRRLDLSLLEEVGQQVSQEIRPITDVRSTDYYRREVSKVLLKEAIEVAWERAGGKS